LKLKLEARKLGGSNRSRVSNTSRGSHSIVLIQAAWGLLLSTFIHQSMVEINMQVYQQQ